MHLITKNKLHSLHYEHGITAYAYLMTLMQFTTKQPIKTIDEDVKKIVDIHVDVLSKDKQLTDVGQKFLKSTCKRLKSAGFPISETELEKFILTLPPIEQWLIKIPYFDSHLHGKLHHRDYFLHRIIANVPFFTYEEKSGGIGDCWIPSFSITQYILEQVSPHPVYIKPVFGIIDFAMLLKMHAQNIHPGQLYGLDDIDNPERADRYRCGPLVMWLHDLGHAFWGSMLSVTERNFLFYYFIPQLEGLINAATQHLDKKLIIRLREIIEEATDFDLTDIRFFGDNKRFITYLSRTFGSDGYRVLYPDGRFEYEKIGSITEDRLYFLLCKMQHELGPEAQKERWAVILQSIRPENNLFRDMSIIKTIEQIARLAANRPVPTSDSFVMVEEDYRAWLKIIHPSKTSKEVWNAIFREFRDQQFMYLVSHGHLLFFHPYLPLRDSVRTACRKVLEDKLMLIQSREQTALIETTRAPSLRGS